MAFQEGLHAVGDLPSPRVKQHCVVDRQDQMPEPWQLASGLPGMASTWTPLAKSQHVSECSGGCGAPGSREKEPLFSFFCGAGVERRVPCVAGQCPTMEPEREAVACTRCLRGQGLTPCAQPGCDRHRDGLGRRENGQALSGLPTGPQLVRP